MTNKTLRLLCIVLLCAPLHLYAQTAALETLGLWQTESATYDFQHGGRLEIIRQSPLSGTAIEDLGSLVYFEVLTGSWSADETTLRIVLEQVDYQFENLHATDLGLEVFSQQVAERIVAARPTLQDALDDVLSSTQHQLLLHNEVTSGLLSIKLEGPYHINDSDPGRSKNIHVHFHRQWNDNLSSRHELGLD